MGRVTVCCGTFGGHEWIDLARQRALPSARLQCDRVIHVHARTLAEARNLALAETDTEFVIFLDADDELAPGYIETLLAGSADIRVPSVSYVAGGIPRKPYVPKVAGHDHQCEAACLEAGNYAVIGSLARTERVRAAGGFGEEAVYEDWALWLRMYRAGATVETIPAATYIAHVRPDSRNRAPSMEAKNRVHREIVAAVGA